MTPLEVAYDEMARDGGQGLLYIPILNYATGDLDHVREMMLHPQGLLGLADGGAHTGTICDASMPTFMLTHWTRDRSRGETLPLEYVVKKQTHDTAALRHVGPGHGGAGRAGRLQPHRLRGADARRPLRDGRPAGGRSPAAPEGVGVRGHHQGRHRDLRAGRRRPASCPAAWSAARAERGRPSAAPALHRSPRRARPARQTAPRMDAPLTQYALRDGVHVGYQVWGRSRGGPGDPVDVLEFNSGLMISIDEAVDEPNWLRYTERVAEFSRLIRFDTGGLGLSDPLPAGSEPSIEGWGRDALAVMDAAGVPRRSCWHPPEVPWRPCGWRPPTPSGSPRWSS